MDNLQATIYHKNIIGIFGLIGSGKSYVSKLVSKELGYHHLDCDALFKRVIVSQTYLKHLCRFLEEFEINPIKGGVYDSEKMFKTLFSDDQMNKNWELLKALNKFNYPFLYSEIIKELTNIPLQDKVLIEMATLPASPISTICRQMIMVTRPIYPQDISRRDPKRDLDVVPYLIAYQSERVDSSTVDIIENINQDDLINEEPYFRYASDKTILETFENIIIEE